MSRFLVDTQVLLWNVYGSRRLPAKVARLFQDGRHEFFYSAASLWEIAVKAAHAAALSGLPPIHADPFDRMLIAQALAEPMALITSDERLAVYPGTIEVV